MNKNVFHNNFLAMNTRMDVILWGDGQEKMESVFCSITACAEQLEKTLSRFNPDAETYLLNQALQNGAAFKTCAVLTEVLAKCEQYFQMTKAYFDVCYQNRTTSSIWPILFNADGTCRSIQGGIQIDFGAIGKGIVLQEVDTILKNNCIENALISFGDSSILTRGKHPHGEYWPFAFQNNMGIDAVLELNNDCLSISGLHNDVAHIVNPINQQLITEPLGVCVQTDNAMDAEVLSTALIAAPKNQHEEILAAFDIKKLLYSDS